MINIELIFLKYNAATSSFLTIVTKQYDIQNMSQIDDLKYSAKKTTEDELNCKIDLITHIVLSSK